LHHKSFTLTKPCAFNHALDCQRIATVEPVFANIRHHKKMDRFTLRTKVKVGIQWLLYCVVHNIEKMATKTAYAG
jgi:Transposase DDE domain